MWISISSSLFLEAPIDFEVALPKTLTLPEAEELKLSVTLSKDKPVVWYKNGKPISNDDTHYELSVENKTHTLRVHHAKPDDQAVYSLSVGSQKAQTKVTIEGTCTCT